jgi:ABC-2 type transport system ATP-binding protein
MPAIEVRELVKTYGGVRVVDAVTFDVEYGEVFALLGPNGAGKTTMVEILEGFRHASAGHVRVLGCDPAQGGRDYRERIGVVLQAAGFEDEFTVRELLVLQSRLYPRSHDPDALLELVGLSAKADQRVGTLSGGQQRRLDLALGVVGCPEVLFLDEPTTGLDPVARRHTWELVRQLRAAGTTVLLTTHYLEEAEALADRVLVLRAGRVLACGAPDQLGAHSRTPVVRMPLPDGLSTPVPRLRGSVSMEGSLLECRTDDLAGDLHVLTGWALEQDISLSDLEICRSTLEDAYLELIGSRLT